MASVFSPMNSFRVTRARPCLCSCRKHDRMIAEGGAQACAYVCVHFGTGTVMSLAQFLFKLTIAAFPVEGRQKLTQGTDTPEWMSF